LKPPSYLVDLINDFAISSIYNDLTLSSSSVSLMFSKKTISQELVERFNKALKKIKSQKDYKKNWNWAIE